MNAILDLNELSRREMFLNTGCFISESFEDGKDLVSFGAYINEPYWNNVYLGEYDDSTIAKYEPLFAAKKVPLAFYVSKLTHPENAGKLLEEQGFLSKDKDALMVLKADPKPGEGGFGIVGGGAGAEPIFLEIFDEVFCKLGTDVYSGTSKDYLKALENYFQNYPSEERLDIVVYKDSKPAGIAQVLFDDKYAYLGSIAVLPEFRKQGALRGLISYINDNFNDKIIFLTTEKDSIDEEIYKRLGFETVLDLQLFVREEV